MNITLTAFTGEAAKQYTSALAELRITVFRDYPYLYDGSLAYEEEYLETFIQSPESIIVVAFDGAKAVGASTGIPLNHEPEPIKRPWLANGYDINKIYYLSESVLLKAYRGQGIGVQFFEQREAWARGLNYEATVFCGVIRAVDDPYRPEGFVPLNDFWKKRGYRKMHGLTCPMEWKEIHEMEESEKELQFWYKRI